MTTLTATQRRKMLTVPVSFRKSMRWAIRNRPTLRIGQRVRALRWLDPGAASVRPGTLGTVTHGANAYGDELGPMVDWDAQKHRPGGSYCNVYLGDIEVVRR